MLKILVDFECLFFLKNLSCYLINIKRLIGSTYASKDTDGIIMESPISQASI